MRMPLILSFWLVQSIFYCLMFSVGLCLHSRSGLRPDNSDKQKNPQMYSVLSRFVAVTYTKVALISRLVHAQQGEIKYSL